jgi:tRNA(Ile)-lysidine synthase
LTGPSLVRGVLERLAAIVAAAFADLEPGDLVLAAVSGGADSTALARLLAHVAPARRLELELAHLDHGLRPDSAATAEMVAGQAEALGLKLHRERVDVAARARRDGLGIEAAGRAARHAFLESLAARRGARAVALAHTLDDRAETLLLKLVRGAGPTGLGAMREQALGLYRRPLLALRREELRAWLGTLGVPWHEDPSNADLRFARNRVRHQVLPQLLALNPRAVEALGRAARWLADEDAYLEEEVGRRLPASGAEIEVAALQALPPGLRRRAALAWLRRLCGQEEDLGAEHVDALLALADGRGGALATDLPGGLRLVRERSRIRAVRPAGAGTDAGPGGPGGGSR